MKTKPKTPPKTPPKVELPKISKFDKWVGRVRAYCHDCWGRGGFEGLTPEAWEDWWMTEARVNLTEWEFACHVVLPYVAWYAVWNGTDKARGHEHFAEPKVYKRHQRDTIESAERMKTQFLRPAERVAKTGGAKADPEEEGIEVGALEQPPRPVGKLRRVHSKPGTPPLPLAGLSPRQVLVWIDMTTDYFADQWGEFPTITCLIGFAHQMPGLDYDDAVVVSKTIEALLHQEDQIEKATLRAMVVTALKPPEPKPEKIVKPKKDGPVKSEQRTGIGGVVTVTEGKKGGKRFLVFGFPVTAVIRWMGADAWLLEEAQTALKALGLADVELNTVKAQLLAGRKGERKPPAALSKAQEDTLYSVLEKSGGKAEAATDGRHVEAGRRGKAESQRKAKGKVEVLPVSRHHAKPPAAKAPGKPPTRPARTRKVKPPARPARKPPKTAPSRAERLPPGRKPAPGKKQAGKGK